MKVRVDINLFQAFNPGDIQFIAKAESVELDVKSGESIQAAVDRYMKRNLIWEMANIKILEEKK